MNISQWIHFGVDGVIECFKWIYENRPDSIFDEYMFKKLKEWHIKYNLYCGLYIYEECGDFNIKQLPDIYWKELLEESNWIKFSWRGKTSGKNIENDIAEEGASLDRVYRLITEKTKNSSWGCFAKLNISEKTIELMDKLIEYGISTFLVDDIEEWTYLATKQEQMSLERERYFSVDSIHYCQTDLSFDHFADGALVEDLLNITENYLNEYPDKPYIDAFFHEVKFKEIVAEIEEYWEKIHNVKVPLIMNKGILVGKQTYFTTLNTVGLYVMDVEKKEVEHLIDMPFYKGDIFSSMVCCNGHIWIVPTCGENILVFNIRSKKLEVFSLSFLIQSDNVILRFDGYFSEKNYLWFLPQGSDYVIRIDMENKIVEKLSKYSSDLIDSFILFTDAKTILANELESAKVKILYEGINLLQIQRDDKIVEKVRLWVSLQKANKWYIEQKNSRKDDEYDIKDYIYDVCNNINGRWTEIRHNGMRFSAKESKQCNVGDKIYQSIVGK